MKNRFMRPLLLSLVILFGLEFPVARPEPLDSWRIEVEKTNRFIRSREYRLGGPQSLTWVYEPYERDLAEPWSMKLGEELAVAPWPIESWASEHDVPRRDTRRLDPADEESFWRLIHAPFFGERVEGIPGYYPLRHYVFRLIDGGRLPKRVRIEYEQAEYRGVCTVTVLEWGDSNRDLQDYDAEPSSGAMALATFSVDPDGAAAPAQNNVDLSLLSIDGVKLGVSSEEVLSLWRQGPFESHVSYAKGKVMLVQGDSLAVGNHLYRSGDAIEPLLQHLEELGFEDYEFPISEEFADRAEELRAQIRAQSRTLQSRDAILSLQLENGKFTTAMLVGGSDLELHDGRLNWMGPTPTIHGVSLKDNENDVIEKLGPPHRVHEHERERILCYDEGACRGSELEAVKAHVRFENGRCRQIRGNQFEQAGQLKLGSGILMPPPHSLSEVAQVLSFRNGAFTSRPVKGTAGPVTVAYNLDLGMQVWIYPDGRRQLLLQEVELPETIIDMEFP